MKKENGLQMKSKEEQKTNTGLDVLSAVANQTQGYGKCKTVQRSSGQITSTFLSWRQKINT